MVFGILLSLAIALLVVFGILAPLFTMFRGGGRLGLEMVGSTTLPLAFMVFAAAFSFYWGGMISSYRAPVRRKLHGTLVAPVTFTISPLINILSGNGLFPGLESSRAAWFMVLVLLVSTGGAYAGARRGEGIYAHNRKFIRRRQRKRLEKQTTANEPEHRG
ncbi:hypothetical protein BH24ACT22_BH24ACT22_03450 [soil metagenome]